MEQKNQKIIAKAVRSGILRAVLVSVCLIVQMVWFGILAARIYEFSIWVQYAFDLIAFIIVLVMLGREKNSAYKVLWTVVLLTLPLFGIVLYLLIGSSFSIRSMRHRYNTQRSNLDLLDDSNFDVIDELRQESPVLANQAWCIATTDHAPLYHSTDVDFFSQAEDGLEAQLEAIRSAQHFVFMEYHAIEDSVAFRRIEYLLAQKAAEGVEVRILYDDFGSIGFISAPFIDKMRALGISCRVFNPLVPLPFFCMNHRDHRKITVVDGRVGFTGGYNLADEYFNIKQPYGRWKDSGVRLEGTAVRSLTTAFLKMWNTIENTDEGDYDRFFPVFTHESKEKCWVQPYADSPLDTALTGEDAYLNVIKGATRRLWITTPYLIIDDEMTRELTLAARRGVDVRIVTPGIPDKPFIYKLTRSYYGQLVRHGVRIFEWTPGFIHAKQMLADEDVAIVGTINLDYRSLYLHFENAVAMYRCSALKDIADDFEQVFSESCEVTELYQREDGPSLRLGRRLLRLIAPLL